MREMETENLDVVVRSKVLEQGSGSQTTAARAGARRFG
jgi:hypothetical protein